jgi:hypothetical protein
MRALPSLVLAFAATAAHAASTVVLPGSSFSNYTTLQQYWTYLYPWGSDHNGCKFLSYASTDWS